ncbi:ATP-binding cassette domain-containing protein [Acidipropionibacterium virtanenii]|uniref:UvrABC system protein A n=1 Tax=Acidipropionibacterium virtanenii TaxID=2057246 RepID=A0A344URX4_9ACTN|nr:ATP-binding cassette domain-containing protein [Acidipropionibacterium virtanenii]AXE38022.1 UvrABC system protein A [Acidipropionibacterium virtanenii]
MTGQTPQELTGRAGWITVEGARTNNLRSVSVRVPKHRITVFTGVSGSGKSSLAFGTIAAEAQRLVADSYPLFVRNRLRRIGRADVDRVDGLMFTTVVDQRPFTGNARSTVGTATDIAPLLRMLFSRIGAPSAGYSPAYSFNDPSGMCPACEGLGTVDDIDLDALLDRTKSLNEGAIRFSTFRPGTYRWKRMVHSGLVDPDVPLSQLPEADLHTLLHAEDLPLEHPDPQYPKSSNFDGVIPRLRDSYLRRTPSHLTEDIKEGLARIVTRRVCPECGGARLNAAARSSLIDGRSIADWQEMPIGELRPVVSRVHDARVTPLVEAIGERCAAMDAVGLGYLSLDRLSTTLSGGEAQRVKIVRHLGSALSDVCYVFDEPSAGLHPHDVHRLLALLARLRDAHNTVLVVEHHPAVIAAADHVVDLGPGAGTAGGRIQFQGPPRALARSTTMTGRMLRDPVRLNTRPRPPTGRVTIEHARMHNLRDVTVDVPLGVLTAVSGVAGSGKSSLMADELVRQHTEFALIGQEPLHGGGRSTPATVMGVAEPVRDAFAAATGMAPSWFSANGRGGCQACRGRGVVTTDLAFLDDVVTTCEACGGSRFNPTALAATLDGQTIADVLAMNAGRAAELMASDARISGRLGWLEDVGLGYLAIGQGADTLSGGERQRLLLARHLADTPAASRLRIVLDEPTAGLHGADIDRLLVLFDRLVDEGATIIAIEHNLRVIAHADHVIDIGPGAGHEGGTVVHEGPPADLTTAARSLTGRYLRRTLPTPLRPVQLADRTGSRS